MLTLSHFTKFPSAFKDREKLINKVELQNIRVTHDDENTKIIITSNTKSGYQQEIEIEDDKISLRSHCKVFCTCESFKFEFSHAIFRNGSLLKPIDFIRSIVQRPKEKNKYDIPSPCKHLAKVKTTPM